MHATYTVALIQARMGSTRLPCKMMLHLAGHPLIDWVLRRVGKAALVDKVVVATSTNPENDVLERHLAAQGVSVFRGPENDVLERFRQAGAAHAATHVVRVCADNPLIWGGAVDELVRFYFKAGCDYAYNHIPKNNRWPDGLGAEIVSFPLLQRLAEDAALPAHREHCLSYIWDNPNLFSIRTFDPEDPRLHRPDLKLDVDTADDYRYLALLPLTIDSGPLDILAACAGVPPAGH